MSTGAAAPSSPEIDALQLTLSTEHAAVFVLGALGAQTSAAGSPGLYADLVATYRLHQQRRDELEVRLLGLGAVPTAAEPGYVLPTDLGSTAAVTRRARALEEAAAAAYAHLVANSVGASRRWGVEALLDAAVRTLTFGGRPSDLPGLSA